MATVHLPNDTQMPETLWESRTYVYYSRYPAIKPAQKHRSRRNSFHRMSVYVRLALVAGILLVVGGICPLLLSYELVFKPLVNLACEQCQVVSAKPYFEFNYLFGSVLGVLGLMMPIFILYVLYRIMQSRSLRHDLFH